MVELPMHLGCLLLLFVFMLLLSNFILLLLLIVIFINNQHLRRCTWLSWPHSELTPSPQRCIHVHGRYVWVWRCCNHRLYHLGHSLCDLFSRQLLILQSLQFGDPLLQTSGNELCLVVTIGVEFRRRLPINPVQISWLMHPMLPNTLLPTGIEKILAFLHWPSFLPEPVHVAGVIVVPLHPIQLPELV